MITPIKPGLYLLTGSTLKKVIAKHTGTGRISTISMYPMSLFESGESNGAVSLKGLFEGKYKSEFATISDLTIEHLAFAICGGGWPENVVQKYG